MGTGSFPTIGLADPTLAASIANLSVTAAGAPEEGKRPPPHHGINDLPPPAIVDVDDTKTLSLLTAPAEAQAPGGPGAAPADGAAAPETDWKALVDGGVGLGPGELWSLSAVLAAQLARDAAVVRGGAGRLSDLAAHCPRLGGDADQKLSQLGYFIAQRLGTDAAGAAAAAPAPPAAEATLGDKVKYGQLLTLLVRTSAAGRQLEARSLDAAAAYAALKARPLADAVLQPKPMPVQVADPAELEPFFAFLRDGGRTAPLPADGGIVEFGRGIYAADGRMDLCKQVVGPPSIGALMDALKGNPLVKHFLLGNNLVGRKGARAVADYIAAGGSCIVTWYLAGNCLDAEAVGWIAAALEGDATVEALWLKRNPVLPAGCKALGRMLAANRTLRTLDLDNCGILDEGVRELMEGLRGNDALRCLYLSANGIGPAGAAAVAGYFAARPGGRGLEGLYMSVNRIGDDGAAALAAALAGDRGLKRLVLSSNRIEARGAAALSAALSGHPSLEVLDLGAFVSTFDMAEMPNRIGDEGAAAVAALVAAEGCRLKVVSVVHNGLTLEGWRAMAAAASLSTTLLHVDVAEPGLGAARGGLLRGGELQTALAAALARNVAAAYGPDMTHDAFLRHELRYVRSDAASVRAIDSFYRNRAFRVAELRKTVEKFWAEGDTTLEDLAREGLESLSPALEEGMVQT